MPKTHIGSHHGAPTLFIDDEAVFSAEYWPGWGAPETDEQRREYGLAGEFGLNIYNNAIFAETWVGPAEYDFSQLEGKFQKFVDVNPNTLLHIRMPIEAPQWWREQYPDECELLEDGTRLAQSYASRIWRNQAADLIRAYIEFVRSTWIGDRVVAYHPCASPSQEWVPNNAMYNKCSDYSEPMRRHFRAWLAERYGDDATLRRAWQRGEVSLETVEVPSPQVQCACGRYSFRDPIADRTAIDYLLCFNALVADDIIHMCRAAKEACDHENIVGIFYGYLMELSWNAGYFYRDDGYPFSAYARSGHLALKKLLDADVVDFFSSPLSYGFRAVGGEAPYMTLHDSIKAHGKIYFAEDDCRSHLGRATDTNYGVPIEPVDSVSIYRRNFAQALCRSSAIWWLGGDSGANTNDPDLRGSLAQFMRIGRASMAMDRSSAAEIAVVVDDRSLIYEGFRKDLDWSAIFLQRHFGLSRCGAPHDLWHLDDIINGVAPAYKMYLFLNAWLLDEKQRQALRNHVMKDNALLVWIYAPGITDGTDFGAAPISDITGIRMHQEDLIWGREAVITNYEHPLTRALPSSTHWGTPADVGPCFEVADDHAVTLGIIVTCNGRCEPGVVYKDMEHWRSLYVGAPNVPAHVLREMARFAGVHIYSETDDVLYANHCFVALHTVKGERKTVSLAAPSCVYDVYENRQVAQTPVTSFTDVVPARMTKLYYLGCGSPTDVQPASRQDYPT